MVVCISEILRLKDLLVSSSNHEPDTYKCHMKYQPPGYVTSVLQRAWRSLGSQSIPRYAGCTYTRNLSQTTAQRLM